MGWAQAFFGRRERSEQVFLYAVNDRDIITVKCTMRPGLH